MFRGLQLKLSCIGVMVALMSLNFNAVVFAKHADKPLSPINTSNTVQAKFKNDHLTLIAMAMCVFHKPSDLKLSPSDNNRTE